jgi:hypothetical protein
MLIICSAQDFHVGGKMSAVAPVLGGWGAVVSGIDDAGFAGGVAVSGNDDAGFTGGVDAGFAG